MTRQDIIRLRENAYLNPKRWEFETLETMNRHDSDLSDNCWLGVAIATGVLFGIYLWMTFM